MLKLLPSAYSANLMKPERKPRSKQKPATRVIQVLAHVGKSILQRIRLMTRLARTISKEELREVLNNRARPPGRCQNITGVRDTLALWPLSQNAPLLPRWSAALYADFGADTLPQFGLAAAASKGARQSGPWSAQSPSASENVGEAVVHCRSCCSQEERREMV